jgi:mono/diheme cytochrome c family protein
MQNVAMAVAVLALATSAWARTGQEETVAADAAPAATRGTDGSEAQIERGRYLVHEASMCVQCHSPRDRRGELDQSRLLTGGAIPFKSPWPGARRWAFQAPNLRNALGYTETEWIHFLTTGIRRSGDMPRPPMPPYRMTAADSAAIFAYLKSL